MSALPALKKQHYTYNDYIKLPEGAPYQLIGGELVMSPAPSTYHQDISKKLEFKLYEYAEIKNQLGKVYYAPVDVYLKEDETYQPDIIFISKENLGIIKEDKIDGAPDMVIEILSPSTAYYDLKHKKTIYARQGVKEYWLVDPIEKSIEIYENKDYKFVLIDSAVETGKVKSKIISGFEIELNMIF